MKNNSAVLMVLAIFTIFINNAKAQASDIGFTYIEGGIIGGFVNDIETSGSVMGTNPLDVESDADGGGFIGGAWQFSDQMHLFGEYASLGQELEIRSDSSTEAGEYDVVRWRIGVGYQYPLSKMLAYYGRLSLDQLEFKDARAAGFNLNVDADDSGLGAEFGVIWAATPTLHLQGHTRYTAVGGVASSGSDPFESDILVGVNGRWHFRPNIALVAGYEYGKITTLNAGLRVLF
jgi:long-subunit fatty acid transport protein